jgi:hypothetical protein
LSFLLALTCGIPASAQSTPSINSLAGNPPGLSRSVAPYYGAGFELTVRGQGFAVGAEVLANGVPLLPTTLDNATQLRATVPPAVLRAIGTVDITVRQNSIVSNAVSLRVVERGDIDGSRTIAMSDATAVALNVGGVGGEPDLTVSAGDFNLNDAVNIADALALGLFANGTSRNLASPGITTVSPLPAVTGQTLTITGTGFAAVAADMEVVFSIAGGKIQRVVPVLDSATSMHVTVPATAVSGPLQIYRLDSPAGSQPFALEVTGSAVSLLLTSITPLQAASGNGITLSGSGFKTTATDNTVWFQSSGGPISVAAATATATTLTVTVPANATCGGVTVQTSDGTSNAKPFITGTVACPLSLTGLWGGGSADHVALLEGTGFDALSPQSNIVRFQAAGGGTVVAPVLQSGATELHIWIPASAIAGAVTVTVSSTTSNSLSYQPSPPVISSIVPSSGPKGSGVSVTINGTGFVANSTTINAGAGVTVGSIVANATQVTATFTIASDASAGDREVTVSTPGGTSAPKSFTVIGTPAITMVSPVGAARHATLPSSDVSITLTGSNFVANGTTVQISGTGVTSGTPNVSSATSLTATLTITSSATIGDRTLTVTTAAGTSNSVTFKIFGPPQITSIDPPVLASSESNTQDRANPVTITGTGFVSGMTLSVQPDPITVQNLTIAANDHTSASAVFQVPRTLGQQIVKATTTAGTGSDFIVYVTGLTGMTPTGGEQGQSFGLNLTGCFVPNQTSVQLSGSDVTVSNVVVINDPDPAEACTPYQRATATINIGSNAEPGIRNISVTTPAGTILSNATFTVLPSQNNLRVDSVSPSAGAVGTTPTVTLSGYGFVPGNGFIDVFKPDFTSHGVSWDKETVNNVSSMSLRLNIPSNETPGIRHITYNVGSATSSPVAFTVLGAMSIQSHSPTIGYQGGPMFVTFIGQNFVPGGTTVTIDDAGITVTNISVSVDYTRLVVAFNVGAGVSPGTKTITVRTTGPPLGTGITRNITIATAPPAPTLTGISPASGVENGVLTATLTGTNLVNGGASVVFSGGVSVSNVVYQSDTSMTAFLTMTSAGNYTVSVTTAGGTTAALPFSVVPNLVGASAHVLVSHLAGPLGGSGTADGTGNAARFNQPFGSGWSDGTYLYIPDTGNHTIRRIILATGETTTIAGQAGVSGTTNDVGPAARFNFPIGIWGDGVNLYVSDWQNHGIRKIVLATGAVSTFSGLLGSSGTANGRYNSPVGICGDATFLYVADSNNQVIRRIALSDGSAATFAGIVGSSGSENFSRLASRFRHPTGVSCDGDAVHVADYENHRIRKISKSIDSVTTLAGSTIGSTDGASGIAKFNYPQDLWGDGTNLFVADHDNRTVRKVSISSGDTSTLSGVASLIGTADGTGSPGGTARFAGPGGIFGAGGFLYVSDDSNNAIRRVDAVSGATTTFAGLSGPTAGLLDATGPSARFQSPTGMTGIDARLYVTDTNSRIRSINTGTTAVTTASGQAGAGFSDGDASVARFNSPAGMWTDGANIYVADWANSRIRKVVAATGATTTLAGSTFGFQDATGTAARFALPKALWGDGVNLYVADNGNNRIRKIVIATGVVTTLAGSGASAWADGYGTAAAFRGPAGIWGDGTSLYVSDSFNNVIRKINLATTEVTTPAGAPGVFGSFDGTGSAARFYNPAEIWGDRSTLFVADTSNHSIRKVVIATGQVTTIAGGHRGSEDGLGRNAGFYNPNGIWGDGSNLFVSDTQNHTTRKLTSGTLAAPTLSSIAGTSGSQNTSLGVTLTGANFISNGTSVSVSGSGVTVSAVTVTGSGALMAKFVIASGAALGSRDVTVTTAAGTSAPVTFTINP